MATNAANQPFQMPAAPVAGFNQDQYNSFQGVRDAQGMAQPYINQGQNYLQQSAGPVTADDVNQYYNPMASNITAQMQNIYGQQQQTTTGQLTQAAGGVGADRIAVGQSNLANQQDLAAGQTYAGLYQQALQAAQQQKQRESSAGYGISQLGTVAQGAALQGSSALGAAGNQQQQLSQAQLNSPYQQQLAQIAFPYQQAQYLAGITGGLAPAMGGTTSGQGSSTAPSPSPWAQALGIGAGALGAYGASGGFDSSGKGSQTGYTGNTTDAFAGQPGATTSYVGGVSYPQFQARGGPARFAEGGAPDDMPFPGFSPMAPGNTPPETHGLSPIPQIQLQPGSGQFHNNLKLDPPKSSGGDNGFGEALGTVAKVIPFLLKRGGSVNPYDMGRGFADGGDSGESWDPPSEPYDDAAAPSFDDRFGAAGEMRAGSDVMSDPQAAKDALVARGQSHITPLPPPRPAMPVAAPSAPTEDPNDGDEPSIPSAAKPSGYPRSRGAVANADMNVDQYMMPRGKQPYPDALDRDWGQKAARSPWMALVKAGATMAQTRGPIGSVIGAGLGAGASQLEGERKELRSEQDVNQKAQTLYQQALTHLDQYQRKTPHEVATEAHQAALLARSRFAPTNYIGTDGQYHMGAFDPQSGQIIDPATRKPVDGGRLAGRNAGIETQNSISVQAATAAKNDSRYVSAVTSGDSAVALKVLNEYRTKAGLPPLGAAQGTVQQPGAPAPTDSDRQLGRSSPDMAQKFKARFGVDP